MTTKPNRDTLAAAAGALNQFIQRIPIGNERPASDDQAAILHQYGLIAIAAELRAINTNLVAMFGETEPACHWHETAAGLWQGDCSIEIMIDGDIIIDQDYHYCPNCGRTIERQNTEEDQP